MDLLNMQQIATLSAEAAWHLRFELIFLVVTVACFLLSRLGSRLAGAQQPYPHWEQRPKLPRERKLEDLRPVKIETAKLGTGFAKPSASPQGSAADHFQDGTGGADDAVSPRRGPVRRKPATAQEQQGRGPGQTGQNLDNKNRHHRALARQAARMILVESRRDNGKPLEMHQDALAGGASFAHLPEAEAHRVYLVLTLAALRVDSAEAVMPLLQDMKRHRILVPQQLLSLVVKRCVQRRLFGKCLAAYDIAASMTEDGRICVEDHEFWSAMLVSAVETGDFARCGTFWNAVNSIGEPVAQDYICMVRAATSRSAWAESVRLVEAMNNAGLVVECAVGNLVVSACVAAQQLAAGRRMMDLMGTDGRSAVDVVTYNALMKGYAFADDLDEVLQLHAQMRDRGVRPTQVTFGILLDACVNRGDLEHAAEIFQDMIASGCPMNTVLYTTLIKGLARAGRVDKAMDVYKHMSEQSKVKPDIILFSVLIKANCDAGRMEGALRLFESMVELGYKPDEIVFNTLLAGCVRDSNLTLGRKLLDDMARVGVRPSHATASVLIKLYGKCHMLDDAQRLLFRMPEELGLVPEARLYAQLVHASIRERQGRRAVEVYKMMLRTAWPDASVTSSVLGTCLSFNMAETASELLKAAQEAGVELSESDHTAVLVALQRKGKSKPEPSGLPNLLLCAPPTAAVPGPEVQQRPKYRGCYCGPA